MSILASCRLSDEVDRFFAENNNYLIEYSESSLNNPIQYCIVYFSSNNIFFPDSLDAFNEQLIEKNRYEWYRTRVGYGAKHIFIRDVRKRHYLSGINGNLATIEKVIDFLRAETAGYRIITIGSSSGGYASVFFGQKLNAERTYCFNGQFVLDINYPLFRGLEISIVMKYHDLRDFLSAPSRVFYFYSNKSPQDKQQFGYIRETGIQALSFNTKVHGIPFLKYCLPSVFNLSPRDLEILSNQRYDPLLFSVKMVGVWRTLVGCYQQLQEVLLDQSLQITMKNVLNL